MRALIADPTAIAPGRYRRFVQRAEIHGLLADHLYHGEPYLALNAVVLDPAESSLLQELSETFAAAFERAGRTLAPLVPKLIEMGFPWVAAELLAAEEPRTPVAGRFDFVRDEAGHWWLLEYNADTPSGVREAIVADCFAHELLPQASQLLRPNERLAEMLVAAFRAVVDDLPAGRGLGLITDTGELEDLAQMAFTQRLLAAPLAEAGVEVTLGDVDNLRATRRGPTLCGRPIAALYRYFPLEWLLGTPGFVTIYDAVAAGRLRLLNGLYGLLLQHKGLLAWLWQHRDDAAFTAAERAAIQNHLPPSWPLDGHSCESSREDVVVKQVFGREGEEVFFGQDLLPESWAELGERRTYIAQRRIAVGALDAAIPTSAGFRTITGYATVGSYVVHGRWAGYYTRLGGKIVTASAKWLATFVEQPCEATSEPDQRKRGSEAG